MAIALKQSTASQEIPLGPFVDDADGDTQMTALTIANTDIKLWKTGATTLANKNSGGATHISGGIYYAVLDATDTDTLGSLVVFVHVSDALPVRVECVVLPANVYDSGIGGTDKLEVDVVQFGGTNITSSSGRPEVNTTHWGGTAVASAVVNANAAQISGDSTAADSLESILDGGGGTITANITGNLSGSAGSVTGAVGSVAAGGITAGSFAADAITAAKVAADVGTEIAAAVLSAATADPIAANVEEINTVALTGDGSATPWGPA